MANKKKRYGLNEFFDIHGAKRKDICESMGMKTQQLNNWIRSDINYFFEHDEATGELKIIKAEEVMKSGRFVKAKKEKSQDRSFSRQGA